MQPTLVSSSTGLPLRKFGGEDAWRVYHSRGYVVSIEHVEDEPAVVIWPETQSMTDTGAGVYAVCLSAFPHWLTHEGEPTPASFGLASAGYRRMFGVPPTKRELFDLMLTVIDAFPHVARMPPKAKRERPAPIFEATAKVNGQTFHERAI